MFEKWGLYNMDEKDAVEDESSSNQLCEAVSKAREACQLRYLVGASPVVYGIPVSLKK